VGSCSAIKLCAAVAAVEKLKHIQASLEKKMSCTMPLELYSLFEGTEDDRMDASNLSNHHITVAHEIRKIFLVNSHQLLFVNNILLCCWFNQEVNHWTGCMQ
jgi:hypothetical protein